MELLLGQANKGYIQYFEIADSIIQFFKDQGNNPETQQFMLEILGIWLKNEDLPIFEELKQFILSPQNDDSTPLEDQLRYENYYQQEIARQVPNIITKRQDLKRVTKNLDEGQAILEAKELIEKHQNIFKGFAFLKKKQKKVKVSVVELCKEGDTENLVTNLGLAGNNKRLLTELNDNFHQADLLKGMIDYQYDEVTFKFWIKLFALYLTFYYFPLIYIILGPKEDEKNKEIC